LLRDWRSHFDAASANAPGCDGGAVVIPSRCRKRRGPGRLPPFGPMKSYARSPCVSIPRSAKARAAHRRRRSVAHPTQRQAILKSHCRAIICSWKGRSPKRGLPQKPWPGPQPWSGFHLTSLRPLLLLSRCRRIGCWGRRISRRGFLSFALGFSLSLRFRFLLWSGWFSGRSLITLSANI
jgi:hypothetical protein